MRPATNEHNSTPLLHGTRSNDRPAFSMPVVVVLLMAICTMLVISCVDWTLLLFLNHGTSLLNTHDVYFTATAFALLAPVCANSILGILSVRFGSGVTLCFCYLVVAFGMLIMTLFRNSLILFYVAYESYALCTTLRIVRLSIIAQVVPARTRTTVMAIHQLMAPIGAVLGPALWLLIQKWRGSFTLAGWMVVDRFFVNYALAIGTMVGMFFLGMSTIRSLPTADSETSEQNADEGGRYKSAASAKSVYEQRQKTPQQRLTSSGDDAFGSGAGVRKFTYFCTLTLLMQSTMALVRVSFQPILIGVFGADDEQVGKMYTIIGALAFVPPLAVAVLSRVLTDRTILVIGMVLKLGGALMCLPLFGDVRQWQLVVGFTLCIKASNFFQTAAFSAFTKSMGGKKPAKQMGYYWSVCSVGPAVIQFCFASGLVKLFGSWSFGMCALPVLGGFVLVFHPWGWRLLGTQ
eukprot:TRINITY_DN38285_c0_g1_i1.p1 TRINITY_DN38285_c0_g1~~TRINITY_DN38285_c0_g1_i1.p1  ORF type:complete len:493 (+),score=63.94 TRINITY_DN38285_c0_g1_i1:94-1479(+)